MSRILVVEDDNDIRNILLRELSKEGYEMIGAASGTEGKEMLGSSPDLVLMDLMMPGLTGEELIGYIPDDIPVIAISARSSIDDKTSLLGLGCVDYITKPFDIKEVKARVAAHLRTAGRRSPAGHILRSDDIVIDTMSREVRINDEIVRLTRTEYAILKILVSDAGKVISKSEILKRSQEETPDLVESSLKVHMSNLRKKLRDAGGKEYIEAVWGIGFKILTLS